MKAILKQVRISPKKANLIAELARKKTATEAVEVLKFTPKKAAPIIKKLIESAMANAENNLKQNKENLYIKEIKVNEGPTYKRSIPVSRGRAHPLMKRTSHITVELEHIKTPEEPKESTKPKTEEKTKTTEQTEKPEESKETEESIKTTTKN